jgi:two-component system sensor histidine kinase/response regulator
LRVFLTSLFLLIAFNCIAAVNRGAVDSLKNLVETSLKTQADPDTLSINRLNKLAANYFDSKPDSTFYYGQKAIELSRKINYKAGIADGLLQTGHANFFKGNFGDAQQNFDEAISIYKTLNDYPGLSKSYKLYARMFSLQAKYKAALVYLRLALDINNKIKNEVEAGDCYKIIGTIYFSEGQMSAALDYIYKALFIALKNENKRAAAANYNDIGEVLKAMEMYPKAYEYYQKALKLFAATGDVNGVGTVEENIGEVLLAQKQYDRAMDYIFKSIKIVDEQDDKDGISSVYADLGMCYAHKNEFPKAITALTKSLKTAREFKHVFNEAYTLIAFATVYNLQKDYKNAYKYAIEGQKLARTLGNLSVRSNAALELNKTLAGLGQYNNAYTLLNQYITLKDSLNNNGSIQKQASYNLEDSFRAKERQLQQQHLEKDIIYQQSIKQQRLINIIFLVIIVGMITISMVYYRQKRKQQKINAMLEDKNHEVLKQKTDIDYQAAKLNDLNTLKDRLISVLAHDLRAPLSTLRGLFSLLVDETITHQQLLDMIPNVLKKLEYTSDFLDTLLFWINSQMENFENSAKSFYVKDIVAYETENYHEQATLKGIKLIDSVPDDIVVSADPNSIRIVMRNLITNAIKFSQTDDTIEITATQQDDHTYVISVSDTGTGMSEEQRSKLFKSKVNSKTGTNNESGTGMGMLFCKDLVERCNGTIWVSSTPGEGTKFSFTLPAGVLSDRLEVA